MNDVDKLVTQLKEKHGEKYTPVQLNCWAHMLHTNKHESMEVPPNKSFFGKKRSNEAAAGFPYVPSVLINLINGIS